MPDISVLDTIKSVYDITNPTVRDFMPDNSTGDINQEKQSNEDFFPGKNQSINAGSYSGSEVGSIPIYAPQGELVPFAAYGARDRVIEKAAQEKMKDLMNYQKSINPPETKLQGVNPALHEAYYNMLEQEQNRMKKQYGRDWVKYANQDIEFQRKNQAYKDLATYHDQFVDQYANDDQEMKLGKFVPTEQYLETRKKILSATNFINDPNNPLVKELPENFLKFKLEREFSGAANEFIKEQVKKKRIVRMSVDESNPDYFRIAKTEEESYTPDQLKQTAQAMKDQWYRISDYWTEDKIAETLQSMFGNKQTSGTTSIQQKRDDGESEQFDTEGMEESSHKINVQPLPTVASQESGVPQKESSFDMGNYSSYTKPVKVKSAIGSTIYPTSVIERKKGDKIVKEGGLFPTRQPEDKMVTLGGIGIGDVELTTGYPVTAEQIAANPKMKTKKAVLVHGSYNSIANTEEGSVDNFGDPIPTAGDKKPGTEVPFLAQASDYKNALKKKVVKGGLEQYDYLQKKADEMNKAKFSAAAPADKKTSVPSNAELRRTKDGRNAYFDKTTKKFISWQ